jgi:hypothetical protein
LLRESAKTTKEIKDRKMFKLSKRLGAEEEKDQVMALDGAGAEKRKRDNDGKGIPVNNSAPHKAMLDALKLK